jgi:UDP-glucose 4-epimerase
MNILITGAFGNIGLSTLQALAGRGHQVRCFDLPTRTNQKLALAHAKGMQVVWGDVRKFQAVQAAVQDQDVVIHLAAIIPELSHTGHHSELEPDLSHAVNVGGMRNLVHAVKAMARPARILFTSTLSVYGRTQHLQPPRDTRCATNPMGHYALQKVMAEQILRASGLDWAVFRLAVAVPIKLVFDRAMFLIPPHNRIEFVHTRDAGLALANAVDQTAVWGQVWHIGGGPRCQTTYGQMQAQVMALLGQTPLPEKVFSKVDYSVDWLDTTASQALLQYQQRTFDDYVQELNTLLGKKLFWIRLLRPLVRQAMLLRSVLP